MSSEQEIGTYVGPIIGADGRGAGRFRQGRDGGLVTADAHGRLYEQTSRGKVFSVQTALTGTTIVAGNVAPPAAAAATVLTLSNPVGSGVNLEILLGFLLHISGTPGAGGWTWCTANAVGTTVITAAVNATPQPMLTSGGNSVASAWTQTALTAGPLHKAARLLPSAQFAGAIAATTPGQSVVDIVDGGLVIAPGWIVTLAPPATGTTHVVVAGIVYAEVPIPS